MNKIEQEKQVRGWITTNYRPWGIESRVKQDRTRKTSKRVDNNQLSAVGDKRKIESRVKLVDELHFEANHSDPDDNLNALLKVYSFTILTKMFLTIKVLNGACFAW